MSEKTITAAKFLDLNIGNVTFVDVREKDDVFVHPLGNAVNIPFSLLSKHIDEIPKDKPVYVIFVCIELSMNLQKPSCMLVYPDYTKTVRQNFHIGA